MKIFLSTVFAFAMMLSVVFVGDAISSNGTLSVNAQSKVERKTKHGARKVYHKGRYVVIKTKHGTKKVWRASKRGTVKVFRKTKHGTKKVFNKVKKAVT